MLAILASILSVVAVKGSDAASMSFDNLLPPYLAEPDEPVSPEDQLKAAELFIRIEQAKARAMQRPASRHGDR